MRMMMMVNELTITWREPYGLQWHVTVIQSQANVTNHEGSYSSALKHQFLIKRFIQRWYEHLTLYLEHFVWAAKNRALCLYRLQSSVVSSKLYSRHSSCPLQADAQCSFDFFFTTVWGRSVVQFCSRSYRSSCCCRCRCRCRCCSTKPLQVVHGLTKLCWCQRDCQHWHRKCYVLGKLNERVDGINFEHLSLLFSLGRK